MEESIDPTGEEGEPAPVFGRMKIQMGASSTTFQRIRITFSFRIRIRFCFGLLEGTEFGGIRARFPPTKTFFFRFVTAFALRSTFLRMRSLKKIATKSVSQRTIN